MIDTFISIHDQDLILKLEKNRIFRNLGQNYRYLFLGMRPVDKLKKLKNKVIVVRDLPINIENHKCLYDFTGQWALAHNPELINSDFVNIIHYDCLIFENFIDELKTSFKKNSNCFINFQPHLLTCDYFLEDIFAKTVKKAFQDVYHMDLEKENKNLILQGNLYWQGGGSYACSYENLQKYIDFVEPLLPQIITDKMAAHNIERTVKFFCVHNNLEEVFLPSIMEHIYNSSHDQKYQPKEMQLAIKEKFNDFIDGKLFKKKKFIFRIFSFEKNHSHLIFYLFGIAIKIRRIK